MPTFLDRLINSGMYNGSADSTLSQAERDGLVPDQYYLANYKNADRFKPRNTPVRQKFNGYVNFTFNSEVDIAKAIGSNAEFNNTLSSLVKAADFPSAEFSTDVKNQYNRKRITVNGVQFKPITITAYDTVDSLWVVMLMKMYAHLFQDPLNKYNDNNPEKYFKSLSELNKSLALQDLSMGMSADYIKAIKYGATFVRVGSSIFGERS